MEIGAAQGEAVADVLERDYGEVRVAQDLTGRDRIVLARRP